MTDVYIKKGIIKYIITHMKVELILKNTNGIQKDKKWRKMLINTKTELRM